MKGLQELGSVALLEEEFYLWWALRFKKPMCESLNVIGPNKLIAIGIIGRGGNCLQF